MAKGSEKIQVRKVTDIHTGWTAAGELAPGTFTVQLILDNGAEEYVVLPVAPDAKVMLKMIKRSGSTYFDLERKVLIFGSISGE